jgi:hypothetical protein
VYARERLLSRLPAQQRIPKATADPGTRIGTPRRERLERTIPVAHVLI